MEKPKVVNWAGTWLQKAYDALTKAEEDAKKAQNRAVGFKELLKLAVDKAGAEFAFFGPQKGFHKYATKPSVEEYFDEEAFKESDPGLYKTFSTPVQSRVLNLKALRKSFPEVAKKYDKTKVKRKSAQRFDRTKSAKGLFDGTTQDFVTEAPSGFGLVLKKGTPAAEVFVELLSNVVGLEEVTASVYADDLEEITVGKIDEE